MSKVIVVDCCRNCPSARLYDFEPLCWKTDKKIESPSEMPDWCPLPDLPEKKWIDPHDVDMFDHGENYGWNACLGAITGEVEI